MLLWIYRYVCVSQSWQLAMQQNIILCILFRSRFFYDKTPWHSAHFDATNRHRTRARYPHHLSVVMTPAGFSDSRGWMKRTTCPGFSRADGPVIDQEPALIGRFTVTRRHQAAAIWPDRRPANAWSEGPVERNQSGRPVAHNLHESGNGATLMSTAVFARRDCRGNNETATCRTDILRTCDAVEA